MITSQLSRKAEGSHVDGSDKYFDFSIDEDNLSGSVDFSFLNHSLTEEDRIFVCGKHFCRVGADLVPNTKDDERVRFFGVSFTQSANFPEPGDAERIAKRLRRLGINLVRLHYLDRSLASDINDVKGVLTDKPYPTLNPVAIARLKGFISALSREGIYVDINLHVVYAFRPSVDGLPEGFIPEHSKPLYHFYPAMMNMEAEYAQKLISSLSLKSNPSLAMVEISNESSLLYSWILGTRNPGKWRMDEVIKGVYAESLKTMWQSYSPGSAIPVRATDSVDGKQFLNFLNGLDQKYFEKIKNAVSKSADGFVPTTGTQMLYGGLPELDSQKNMDFLDNHFYYDFYAQRKDGQLTSDWSIKNASLLEGEGMEALSNLAFFRTEDKPYTISEFNQPWPNSHGAEMVPVITAVASFQDWDALIFYQYRDNIEWGKEELKWFSLSGDPSKLANFGQSAMIFRSGAIRTAKKIATFSLSSATREEPALKGLNTWYLSRFFASKFGVSPLLPLHHGVSIIRGETDSVSEAAKTGLSGDRIDSDTDEMAYVRRKRILTLKSEKAIGAFGTMSASSDVRLGDYRIENLSENETKIAVLMTCFRNEPLKRCKRLLVSNPGGAVGSEITDQGRRARSLQFYPGVNNAFTFLPDKEEKGRVSGEIRGIAPILMDRREYKLVINRAATRHAIAYELDNTGRRTMAKRVLANNDGEIYISLGDKSSSSAWYEIEFD
ncbi:hypothetical protein [Cupriavidus basilensis]|uniref:hypothetical protein n=1 Tax=Cupriavidus basilensis TaxID=68895 RepID=UPI00157AA0D0|nr:hypothetical protein [Cupriavidus basilensis]NUA29693.1 hypothetical protein [Cupriavidus basilensis]